MSKKAVTWDMIVIIVLKLSLKKEWGREFEMDTNKSSTKKL